MKNNLRNRPWQVNPGLKQLKRNLRNSNTIAIRGDEDEAKRLQIRSGERGMLDQLQQLRELKINHLRSTKTVKGITTAMCDDQEQAALWKPWRKDKSPRWTYRDQYKRSSRRRRTRCYHVDQFFIKCFRNVAMPFIGMLFQQPGPARRQSHFRFTRTASSWRNPTMPCKALTPLLLERMLGAPDCHWREPFRSGFPAINRMLVFWNHPE